MARARNRDDRLRHPEREKRFGGLREWIIKRDEEKCSECSMTRAEHLKKWGRDLTIHHIDGNGRYSQVPNNSIYNLLTLCLSCHGRTDAKRIWNSLERAK